MKLPSGELGKEGGRLYLASLRLKKLMRSTQRPTKGAFMRSDGIHRALVNIQNRFILCRLVSVATQKYHDPERRVQDVINDVIGLSLIHI